MRIHISLEITLEIQKIHEFSISSTDGSIVVLEGQGSNWKARFPDCTARFLPCAVTGGCSFQKIPPKKSHPKKKTSTNTHNFFNSCNTYQLNLTFTQCGTRPPQSDRSHRAYGTRERECWTPTSQCTTCHGKNSQLTTVGFRRLVYFKEACFFGLKSVKYIVSHVNVYNISSIYGVFTLLGLPEQKSANL